MIDLELKAVTFSVQGIKCGDCGHHHGGPEIGGICVGCPCPSITHEPSVGIGGPDETELQHHAQLEAKDAEIVRLKLDRNFQDELVKELRARVAELEAKSAQLYADCCAGEDHHMEHHAREAKALEALKGVLRVADRKTAEFDAVREAISDLEVARG